MSHDETGTLDPEAPAYAAQRSLPLVELVLRLRAVVAVALACLIIGGLSGLLLGRAAGGAQGGFGPGPGPARRGAFARGQVGPGGAPRQVAPPGRAGQG